MWDVFLHFAGTRSPLGRGGLVWLASLACKPADLSTKFNQLANGNYRLLVLVIPVVVIIINREVLRIHRSVEWSIYFRTPKLILFLILDQNSETQDIFVGNDTQ